MELKIIMILLFFGNFRKWCQKSDQCLPEAIQSSRNNVTTFTQDKKRDCCGYDGCWWRQIFTPTKVAKFFSLMEESKLQKSDMSSIFDHSSVVGSKPLSHSCGQNSNFASAFRAVLTQPKNTSSLDLVPALAALNKSTHYECEITSRCAVKVSWKVY